MITKDRSIAQGYDGMELLNRIGETPLLFCISGVPEDQTDYPGRRFSYVFDVSPLINWIEETPSIRSGRPPRKAELSRSDRRTRTPDLSGVFSHLNQVADFGYGASTLVLHI